MTAFAFPLALGTFWDILPIASITFDAPEQVEMDRTGNGEILTADLGPRLWGGEVRLSRRKFRAAGQLAARLDVLREAGASFMAYDIRQPGPAYDPTGDLLTGVAPSISALAADNRRLSLAGLPAAFELGWGDYLAFSYLADPSRYALHRVAGSGVVADASGATGYFEVSPRLRPGAAIGNPVTLYKPSCKARIIPGSLKPGTGRGLDTEGLSFEFVQTLR